VLGGISAVQAGSDRNLAASGGAYDHYAGATGIPNFQPPVNGKPQQYAWADPVNLLWAQGDTKGPDGMAGTPAPSESFGGQTCRGYFQSPIDVPKKSMMTSLRLNNDVLGLAAGGTMDRKQIAVADSMFSAYMFNEGGANGAQGQTLAAAADGDFIRSTNAGGARLYVGMLGGAGGLHEKYQLTLGAKATDGVTKKFQCTGSPEVCDTTIDPVVIYQPLQFHWHFPSEHTIDGIGYPGELHIVHSRWAWFRSGGSVHHNKGAGMFRSQAALTAFSDSCSGATGSNGCITGQTCGATANVRTGEQTATYAYTTSSYPSLSQDNVPKDTATCSAAAQAKFMPFLVLGFMLTEDCNMLAPGEDETAWDKRDKHKYYNAPVGCREMTGKPNDEAIHGAAGPEYNEGFLGGGVSANTADVKNDQGFFLPNAATGLYIGDATKQFSYKATFGEAMKGPYFRYQGALTTPPCTEGVEWVLFERALKLKEGSISLYMNNEPDLGKEAGGVHGSSTMAPTFSATNGPIADLMKATPLQIRNNRPTVAIHGRDVQYSKLHAITNNAANGAKYNYKRPDIMWASKTGDAPSTLDCTDPTQATDAKCSSCQFGVKYPDDNFQAPINFVGGEVYRGVTPVNRSWLKSNTYGYVGGNVGSAARWVLMNTGHGFNVIPRFSFNGKTPFLKNADPNQPNAAESDNSGAAFYDHRKLAGYGGNTIPAGYYVKKINAAGTAMEWFPMIQFHFHFPSEHTVDGYQYAGEMHLVHHHGLAQSQPGTHVTELQYNVTQYSGGPMLKDSARRLVTEEKVNGKDAVVLDLTGVKTRELAPAAGAASGGAASGASTTMMSSSAVLPTFTPVSAPYGARADTGHTFATGAANQGWANAVVLGFFLEETMEEITGSNNGKHSDSIMGLFGFNRDTGVPAAQGDYWNMDVDSKMFASALFGDMGTKGFETTSSGTKAASQMSTATTGVDAYMKAPYTRSYFNYMGGLTTPPCSEGVQFIIFTDPLSIRPSEAKLFRQNFFMNNRPTQPRGKRVVLFNDMANAAQPLQSGNMMTKVNPFKAPEKETQQTTFLVQSASSSSSGAASTALNMFAAAAASVFAFVLCM